MEGDEVALCGLDARIRRNRYLVNKVLERDTIRRVYST